MKPGAQLAALRPMVTKTCPECANEFTSLESRNLAVCQKCQRKEVNKKYYEKKVAK